MGVLSFPESKQRRHVFSQMVHFRNLWQYLVVNLLLSFFALIAWFVAFTSLLKHSISTLLLLCFTSKHRFRDIGGHLHVTDIDLGLGGNHIRLRDSAKGNSVHFVWTSDQKQSRFELLQEHHSLTLVTASQKNQHSSRGDRASQLSSFRVLPGLQRFLDISHWVESGVLLDWHDSFRSIFVTTNSFCFCSFNFVGNFHHSCLLAFIQSPLF